MAVLLRDIIANGLCGVNVKRSESESESESKYRPVAQISLSLICPPGLLLVGVATPNPPWAGASAPALVPIRQK